MIFMLELKIFAELLDSQRQHLSILWKTCIPTIKSTILAFRVSKYQALLWTVCKQMKLQS